MMVMAILTTTFAENIDPTRAQRVAESLLTSKMGNTPDIHLVDFANRDTFSNFYVFGNESCFVIVSANDCVTPIIGYSTENGFGQSALPDNVFYWLKAYDEEISTTISRQIGASDDIRSEWNSLLNGNRLEPKTRTSVSPLLLTAWDQIDPYNNLCPSASGGSGGHTYTGCVATAMAQVMKYWEHPIKGVGSHSYTCPGFGQQSANFSNTTYNWDNMKSTYSLSYSTTEVTAVATLMFHCGVSVDMAYNSGTAGSGAASSSVPYALKTYFNYANSTEYRLKSSYSDSQWISMLKTELDNARPVYYSGQSTSAGHAFVCDGYDNNNLFHFNWGWNGSCNGYYAIGALNPGAGGSGSGSQGEYNQQNAAIFGCQPNTPSINPPTNVNSSVSGRNVTITWNAASGATSYRVYRDGSLLASGVSGTSYTDSNVIYGNHVYYLKSVTSNGTMSLKSANTVADVHFAGPIPTNLQGSPSGPNAILTWTAPSSETATLQYGTGTSAGGVGYNGSADTYWAQRFPASSLVSYAGMAINKVSAYFWRNGSYTLYIYKGNEIGPSELIQQQSCTVTSTGWKDINLNTPAIIDYSQDLWVVLYAPSSIDFPATYCSYNGSGAADACYLSPNGGSWSQYQNARSWLIKTYITDGTYTYRVYRNNTAIATNVSGTTYTDASLANGTYNYYVSTNYYGGESDHSNTVSVVINGSSVYSISVSADPTEGGTVSGGGNNFSYNQSCTINASANPGYTFVNWTKNGTQVSTNASYTFNVTESATYVAHFQQQTYSISVSADPTAGGTVSGGGNNFNYNQSCTINASANPGYTFVNWTKNGTQVSTNASYTFNVTESATYVAHFSTQSFVITAVADPTEGGSVSGGGGYDYGDLCNLIATANTGFTFVNWTKNGVQVSNQPTISFNVTETATYIAHFQINSYDITVTANPVEGGTVSGGGSFNYGQSCTVHAIANTGYNFVNWTENGTPVSTNADYTFVVQSNRNLVAVFDLGTFAITATCDPETGGSITGTGSYNYGETCTLSITPNENYTFVNWTENGIEVGTDPSISFTVESSHSFVAHLIFFDGINESNAQIELYPNPANEWLHIKGEAIQKIVVVNTMGQVLESMETNGQETLLFNIKHYEPGTYIMILNTEKGGIVTRRFVKQ